MNGVSAPAALTTQLMAKLVSQGLTVAIAESLTGGALVAELVSVPGASAVVNGAIVAYNTGIKRTLLGVDSALLAAEGPVHSEVARQLARNVRDRLAVDGRSADLGIATTGVAGPDYVNGAGPGVVFLGLSLGDTTTARELILSGSRNQIRAKTVTAAIEWMAEALEKGID